MAEEERANESSEHLERKDDPGRGGPIPLEYRSYGTARSDRRREPIWPAFAAAAVYFATVIVLTWVLSQQRFVPTSTSVSLWFVCTTVLLLAAIAIDSSMRWRWKCTKGLVIAFLLTTGLCGLLASICGNPFQPLL